MELKLFIGYNMIVSLRFTCCLVERVARGASNYTIILTRGGQVPLPSWRGSRAHLEVWRNEENDVCF